MDERVVKNLIIGFGKAGKTLAADMAGHGETVMLVEESNTMYGGTCINVGCIPSKKLIVEGEKGQLMADKKEVFARAMALKRSEEHTSELQSRQYLVCRLLLEKKNADI